MVKWAPGTGPCGRTGFFTEPDSGAAGQTRGSGVQGEPSPERLPQPRDGAKQKRASIVPGLGVPVVGGPQAGGLGIGDHHIL